MTRKERKKELVRILKDFLQSLVQDPRVLEKWVSNWRQGFHSYSLFNWMLAYAQKPGVSLLAGFKQWKKVGRFVKPGEKALWILAPYFKKVKKVVKVPKSQEVLYSGSKVVESEEEKEVIEEEILSGFFSVPVFDISQTDGKPLDIGGNQVKGDIDIDIFKIGEKFGYEVQLIEALEDGRTDGKKIEVSNRKNSGQMKVAFFHELAHCLLGHIGDQKADRATKEAEAETVAFLVSSLLGVNSEVSKYYVGNFTPKFRYLKVIKVADLILNEIIGRGSSPRSNSIFGGIK